MPSRAVPVRWLHAGDYLYEYSPLQNARGETLDAARFSGETLSLQRYRDQYALYKLDPDLQAAHAAHAFAVIWDDHEVQNDYSGIHPEKPGVSTEDFIVRRAAYRAFYEHLPMRSTPAGNGSSGGPCRACLRGDLGRPRSAERLLRYPSGEARRLDGGFHRAPRGYRAFYEHLPMRSTPANGGLRVHRRLRYGDLAQLTLLDCRQFRPANPCGVGESPRCEAALDPRMSMLGIGQEAWFTQSMAAAQGTRWNVVVQQLLMAQLRLDAARRASAGTTPGMAIPPHAGVCCRRCRRAGRAMPSCLAATGIHLRQRPQAGFRCPGAPVVATEFIAPAISSGGDDTPYGPYYGPSIGRTRTSATSTATAAAGGSCS